MTKVYLVTTGEYSDFHVCGVFSTLKKAQRYSDYISNTEYVEEDRSSYMDEGIYEYDLDPLEDKIIENLRVYWVEMQKDGTVERVYDRNMQYIDERDLDEIGQARYITRQNKTFLQMLVWAKNQDHAVKIVNEKRAQILANQLWKA